MSEALGSILEGQQRLRKIRATHAEVAKGVLFATVDILSDERGLENLNGFVSRVARVEERTALYTYEACINAGSIVCIQPDLLSVRRLPPLHRLNTEDPATMRLAGADTIGLAYGKEASRELLEDAVEIALATEGLAKASEIIGSLGNSLKHDEIRRLADMSRGVQADLDAIIDPFTRF